MVQRKNTSTLKKFLGELRSCIICNGNNFEHFAKLDSFEAKKCKDCGMISTNPHLTEEGLLEYYGNYLTDRVSDTDPKEKILLEQRNLAYLIDRDWILKFIDHGKVLDVGCSGGQFLNIFDPKKWERLGVDVSKEDSDFAKSKYDIDVKVGFLPNMHFDDKFDLVILRGVIEHISKPLEFLQKCYDLLKPGGYLFITAAPVGDSFAFDVYREKWVLFNPVEHLHFFTVDLLDRKLQNFGLKLIDYSYQYAETPYANPIEDFKKIREDIVLISSGCGDQIKTSVPFPGSMLTAVWQK